METISILLADGHEAYRDGLARAIAADPRLELVAEAADGRRALELVPRIQPRITAEAFLQPAYEVDAFSALNYSKRKRISAADVEQHLRSKGVLCPCNDFLDFAHREDGVMHLPITDAMTRRPLERG